MLVFTKLEDLGEINQARIEQHFQQEELDKAERKQRVYQQLADKQIREVIAAMMSVSVIEERQRKSSRRMFSGMSQHQSGMRGSFISESTTNMPRTESCN